MSAINKNIRPALLVIAPLFIGTLAYAFLRIQKPIFLSWLPELKVSANIAAIDWLPDYLWCFSLLAVVALIWKGWKNIPFTWLAIIWMGVTGSELLQYFGLIFGTFDWKDILAYQFAFITHLIINRKPLL